MRAGAENREERAMKHRISGRRLWGALIAVSIAAASAMLADACTSDGTTPNCPPDGGDCLTPLTPPSPTSPSDAGPD